MQVSILTWQSPSGFIIKQKTRAVASLWGFQLQILKSALWTCPPLPDRWFFMTLNLGPLRGLFSPSSKADSEAGRRPRLYFFSHHGDKKLSQIFAYDFTGEVKQGRLDWKEEHLQKHIWNQQPKKAGLLFMGPQARGLFSSCTPLLARTGSRNPKYKYTFSST